MHRYIQQLIEDFYRAEANPLPDPGLGDSYEEFVNGRVVPAKEKIGVSYEELPPAERMTDGQTQQLLEAMLNALVANGVNVHFPGNGIPVKLAYTELRKEFKKGFNAIPGWTIDFCTGWCPGCAFIDYCDARKEVWTKEEMERKKDSHNH